MKLIAKLFLVSCFSVFFSATNSLASDDNASDNELLPAEEAFVFSAKVVDEEHIKIQWEIAKNYYMYRDKMSFTLIGNDIANSAPDFPDGHIKEDDLFGQVEVYTDQFSTVIPLSSDPHEKYTLVANGQGCNEPIGVCYPPMEHQIVFTPNTSLTPNENKQEEIEAPELLNEKVLATNVPSIESADENSSPTLFEDTSLELNAVNDVNDLRNLLAAGFEQPEFLDVDDAFRLTVSASDQIGDTAVINAIFQIEKGYYLYRDKIDFHTDQNHQIVDISLPEGTIKEDEYFGEVSVFKSDFSVPIEISLSGQPAQALEVSYQGCAEDGICYSPVSKRFDLGFLNPGNSDTSAETAIPTTVGSKAKDDDPNMASLFAVLAGALFAGLLLSFTPCVLPMIPILSSVIVGQGEKLNKTRGGILSVFYVLGTAITYAAMGALAGATGDQLQSYFQNIWAIGFLSSLFLVMSLGMFGVFNLQMPSFIQSRLQQTSGSMGGSIPLVLLLGLISALIIGACVSPILISTLSIAVSQQDPVLGAQIMFAMALGMGIPLIALGFGAGYLIPRAGNWMNGIKNIFGIMLIAVAIYLLESVPAVPTLFLWGSFLVILSIYLGSLQSDSGTLTGWEKLEKGVGIILLLWGIIALVGAFLGQRDVFNPLPQSLISQPSNSSRDKQDHFEFQRVDNLQELETALASANTENKNVIIDYYADWCTDCVRMEKTTFSDPGVQGILRNDFIALQIDVTNPQDQDRSALKKKFNVFGPPAVLFLDSSGNELKQHHFYGYKNTAQFMDILSKL
ncbi:MAG: protein-disulfide reductase DsbD [Gammaproteobacteria bacterium]|nr:protein-disulfide reductase DsbD [Gammaproteobacteria bacterium]